MELKGNPPTRLIFDPSLLLRMTLRPSYMETLVLTKILPTFLKKDAMLK